MNSARQSPSRAFSAGFVGTRLCWPDVGGRLVEGPADLGRGGSGVLGACGRRAEPGRCSCRWGVWGRLPAPERGVRGDASGRAAAAVPFPLGVLAAGPAEDGRALLPTDPPVEALSSFPRARRAEEGPAEAGRRLPSERPPVAPPPSTLPSGALLPAPPAPAPVPPAARSFPAAGGEGACEPPSPSDRPHSSAHSLPDGGVLAACSPQSPSMPASQSCEEEAPPSCPQGAPTSAMPPLSPPPPFPLSLPFSYLLPPPLPPPPPAAALALFSGPPPLPERLGPGLRTLQLRRPNGAASRSLPHQNPRLVFLLILPSFLPGPPSTLPRSRPAARGASGGEGGFSGRPPPPPPPRRPVGRGRGGARAWRSARTIPG